MMSKVKKAKDFVVNGTANLIEKAADGLDFTSDLLRGNKRIKVGISILGKEVK